MTSRPAFAAWSSLAVDLSCSSPVSLTRYKRTRCPETGSKRSLDFLRSLRPHRSDRAFSEYVGHLGDCSGPNGSLSVAPFSVSIRSTSSVRIASLRQRRVSSTSVAAISPCRECDNCGYHHSSELRNMSVMTALCSIFAHEMQHHIAPNGQRRR